MKAGYLVGLILTLLLSACGGGGGGSSSDLSGKFGANTMPDCTAGSNTSCATPGGNDTTANSIIVEGNYITLAKLITAQMDYLVRAHTGYPPTLTYISTQLLNEIQTPGSTSLCNSGLSISSQSTISSVTFAGCVVDGFTLDGFLSISGITNTSDGFSGQIQATIDISNLSMTSSGGDQSLEYNGGLGLSVTLENNGTQSTTDMVLTNLSISKNSTDFNGNVIIGDPDIYTNATLTSTVDANNTRTLQVFGSVTNNSVTGAALTIATPLLSGSAAPLTWSSGAVNPVSGWLRVSDANASSSLLVTANSATNVTVDLNGGVASGNISWGG